MVGILNTLISNNGYYYVLSQINFTRLKSRGFNNAISHEHKKQLENIAELTKDHELAQFLILHNAAISFSESFMAQLFQRALNNEDITFINYLINERKVDPQGRYACTDNETVITYMLKNKIVPEDTKKDIFELFLTQFGGQCLEADGSTALNVVCEQQNNQLLETIIQRQPLDTQTAFSAFQHLLKNPISNSTRVEQCISLLLEKNHDFCNVNDQSTNRIPLHDVSRSAQLPVECLEQLLLYTTNLDAQDSQGNTSLTEAVKSGNVAKVDLLVSRGANVNTQNHAGETPLGLSLKNYQSYPHYQSYPQCLTQHTDSNKSIFDHLIQFKLTPIHIKNLLKIAYEHNADRPFTYLKNRYFRENYEDIKKQECPVCFEAFQEKSILAINLFPTCGHLICNPCLQKWKPQSKSREYTSCPLCRTKHQNKRFW